jgi:hypothetical protein
MYKKLTFLQQGSGIIFMSFAQTKMKNMQIVPALN